MLFLIFNRPQLTQRVFDAIAIAKPKRLYIAADGPRESNESDNELCAQTREVTTKVNWDCEVKTLFRQQNLGCKTAVAGAINWFFEHEEEGIILEDDCLPHESFFRYCEELLHRYRNDERVMSVSGSNLLGKPWKYDEQSYFFAHGGIWGWATWRRAWQLYDRDMKGWPDLQTQKTIKENIQTKDWYNFYAPMFEASYNDTLDTWDIQWFYTILVNNGLAINPAVNLVSNIGFANGTHLNSNDTAIANLSVSPIAFPLVPPPSQKADKAYLKLTYKHVTGGQQALTMFPRRVINFLRKSILGINPQPAQP
ncbi:nucleotide-diphospho-sugar transferase [Mucilaginibacter pedocola]|uniref:nucleotide-diphospho-sugar transferase n=1 Tax=Mucilaginibacter pedocola TaxID=1792845 RepID=UPI00117EC6C7|nr:nucleotide-diphospho-sugar transferase [Mucilaginibacter pedocola]